MATAKKTASTPAKATPASAPKSTLPAKATSNLPAAVDELLASAEGTGFEEASRESFALPFLRVLQPMSPQVLKSKPEYIKGAVAGMMLNTVTQKLYERVRVVPCHFSELLIEWTPRDSGGGFVAAHPTTSPLRTKTRREGSNDVLPNGNLLQFNAQHFVLVLDEEEGTAEGALIAMASTQLKYSKRWMSNMKAGVIEIGGKLIVPPMWAWSYELTTFEESNDQGAWFSWQIQDRQRVSDVSLLQQGQAFHLAMRAGKAKVNYDEMDGGPSHSDAPADLDNEIDA